MLQTLKNKNIQKKAREKALDLSTCTYHPTRKEMIECIYLYGTRSKAEKKKCFKQRPVNRKDEAEMPKNAREHRLVYRERDFGGLGMNEVLLIRLPVGNDEIIKVKARHPRSFLLLLWQ
jgi:hypothetical protein